jgi:hypothetical protein
MSDNKCVMVVSPPAGGGTLVGKTLLTMGFKTPGTPGDVTFDWNLVSANQVMCDRPQDPKMGLGMAKYAAEHMDAYIKQKIEEKQNWLMHDPLLCMTFCEFAELLKRNEVDYKVIVVMRMPHHSALDIIRSDKTWSLEKASATLGRYIVARSLNTERFYLEQKEDKDRVLHLDLNQLLDNPDAAIETLAGFVGVELSEDARKELDKLLKPAS